MLRSLENASIGVSPNGSLGILATSEIHHQRRQILKMIIRSNCSLRTILCVFVISSFVAGHPTEPEISVPFNISITSIVPLAQKVSDCYHIFFKGNIFEGDSWMNIR